MRTIAIGGSTLVALVDDADFDKVSKFTWWVNRKTGHVYHKTTCGPKPGMKGKYRSKAFYLSRFVMGVENDPTFEVDHKDRNTLNNQRSNLRLATRSQNNANKPPVGGTSKFKGVSIVIYQSGNRRIRARIKYQKKEICIGTFKTEEEAASAYDEAALRLFGEFAYLNFPERISQ